MTDPTTPQPDSPTPDVRVLATVRVANLHAAVCAFPMREDAAAASDWCGRPARTVVESDEGFWLYRCAAHTAMLDRDGRTGRSRDTVEVPADTLPKHLHLRTRTVPVHQGQPQHGEGIETARRRIRNHLRWQLLQTVRAAAAQIEQATAALAEAGDDTGVGYAPDVIEQLGPEWADHLAGARAHLDVLTAGAEQLEEEK